MNPQENPFQQQKYQLNQPPTLNSTSKIYHEKLDDTLSKLEYVLKKMAYKRNRKDNQIIQQFIKEHPYMSQIAKSTSIDFAKFLIKDASIKKFKQGQMVCQHNKKIDKIYTIIQGGLGIITSMHLSTDIMIHQQQLSKTLKQIMIKPKQNDFTYIPPQTQKGKLFRRNTIGMTGSLGLLGRQKLLDLTQLDFAKILNKGDSYGDICFANGNIYTDNVVSMTKTALLVLKPSDFIEGLTQYRKKKSAEQIQLFRSLSSAFELFNNEKLSELITLSPVKKMIKGDYLFKENDTAQNIYILLQGDLKITKNVQLFLQNPNVFYANRKKLIQTQKLKNMKDKYSLTPYMKNKKNDEDQDLPFANFSSLYNYQPKNKIIELGILTDQCIFGEEQVFSSIPRQVSVQVSTQTAKFFEISPEIIQKIINQTKNAENLFPMQEFKSQLYETITKKRILYRQKKLAEILQIENKNQMDYFYIGAQEKKTPKKANLIRINKAMSTERKVFTPMTSRKSDEQQQMIFSSPMYNTFNFTKMLLNKNQREDQQSSNMNKYQKTIADKTHTVSLISQKVKTRENLSKKMENNSIKPIDIRHPLFEQDFLRRKYKQTTRLQQAKIRANSYFKRNISTSREFYR